MDLSKRYQVDKLKAVEGVEVEVDGTTFILAYLGSDVAQLSLTNKTRKYIALGLNEDDAGVLAMKETLVQHIVLGWTNLKDEGKEIPYSKENLVMLLDKHQGFAIDLMAESNAVNNFLKREKKQTEKK